MELEDMFYNKADYVETVEHRFSLFILSDILFDNDWCIFQASGNKVCRQTVLCGSQNIILVGKVIVQTDAIVRADLANVRTGRYCIISRNSVIRPPYKRFNHGYV